jgi:hypothetical protein
MGAPTVARRRDLLLRRSFQAGGQPAGVQLGHRLRCPWVTPDDRSFPPVLARMWHDRIRTASSSRSQVAMRAARSAACLTWELPSAGVRCRPPLATAIVTHLVTRLWMASADHLLAKYAQPV